MRHQVLNVDGINLAFERQGRGTPLVLLHGYPLDRTIWQHVAGLLESDFDVLMPDLRGFGRSEVMEADRSITAYATDIAGLLDKLGIKKAHIAGHSMGGYVALAFAREFSSKLSGLGLVASQEIADSPERKAARQETARTISRDGISIVADEMAPKLSSAPEVQEIARNVILGQHPAGLAVALQAMADRLDSTDVLKSINVPLVIVHGDADVLIPIERARAMRSLHPGAHYLELTGAGHMPMLENPAAVAEALRFLGTGQRSAVRILDS